MEQKVLPKNVKKFLFVKQHLVNTAFFQLSVNGALNLPKLPIRNAWYTALLLSVAQITRLGAFADEIVRIHNLHQVVKADLLQIGSQPASAVGTACDAYKARAAQPLNDFIDKLLWHQFFFTDILRRNLPAV